MRLYRLARGARIYSGIGRIGSTDPARRVASGFRRAIRSVQNRHDGKLVRAGDRIAGLSKGLAQRLGFAQAFLGRPRLLLLDEPNSGLDPIGVRDARDWIQTARERGCSLLVSSHVLSEIERTCDQVAILHEGSIAASGEIADIVRGDESLEDAFIRVVRG